MNSKLIGCLALGLCIGLFGCSTHVDGPTGVRLTGHASKANQSWPFEIVMEGFELYYRVETHPKPKGPEAKSMWVDPVRVTVAIDDAGDSKDRAYVGRRLWQGDKFRGVATDELRELVEYGHNTEEFLTPISREHFPVPCVIKWTDNFSSMPNKTTVYKVEEVKFTYRRDPGFFAEARKKYFPDANRASVPQSSWHEPPSPAQVVATNALSEAKADPEAAITKLREAKLQYPLNRPLGGWNQSVLEGTIWQIRGLAEKDGVVDLFYRTLPLAPDSENTDHGDLDHGPLCLLRAVGAAKRPETAQLLTAIIADARFDQTDAATIVEMMEMSSEGFPVPKEIPLDDKSALPRWPVELARALGPKSELLPMWRNVLRRHYALKESGPLLPGANNLSHK